MLTLRCGEQLRARVHAACRRYLTGQPQSLAATTTTTATDTEEYTAEPQYPPIEDRSFRARKVKVASDWHEEIRQLPTVEEKLIKINMPRYYGYRVVDFNEVKIPYNALPLMQHYTRTVMEPMPQVDEVVDKKFDAFMQTAREDIIESLEYANEVFRHQETRLEKPLDAVTREQQLTQVIVEQLNRAVLQTLSADCTHLYDIEVDYNPRHEAFWSVGGVDPPKNVVKSKKGRKWQKEYADDCVDRLVQYTGSPYLALRHRHQLPPWKTPEECENATLAQQLPRFKYDARTLGYSTHHQHAVHMPGYWPTAHALNFGLLSIQSRAHLQLRPSSYGAQDMEEALHVLAIQSSYAWLLALATYNGFNTYNELTYPLNTQTIVTNGREWSFYEYQLNTLVQHGNHVDSNPRVNFCRGTAALPLYAEISPAGKCVDFNDDVLRQLLRFYANVPSVERAGQELHPYLADPTLQRVADYEDVEKREFLDNIYKHLCSNRPRHLELPEIYLWEKLYMIDNKTRSMQARRRYFQLGINPWRRTLDQHDKVYVPRAVREGGKKNREGRFKKTFYP